MKNQPLDTWLQKIAPILSNQDYEMVKKAILLTTTIHKNNPKIATESLKIAETLDKLHLDGITLATSILLTPIKHSELNLLDVKKHLGEKIVKLIHGFQQMSGITDIYHGMINKSNYQNNINNIRKMLLAMVDDIRVVLIKLAEQLAILRYARTFPEQIKKQLATEALAVYAPLTNRLGIAQIKWQLEDLAFLYLEPKKYNQINSALKKQFPEKTKYIDEVSSSLQKVLTTTKIKKFQVTGRTKHIYSIYRKMNRKKKGVNEIYDISAMRIFVPTITDCYQALSAIHAKWKYIPNEFDDYIAAPKLNGYRSIHTAIFGPQNRIVEIQIRTFDMHREAELGIAAHWIYKEDKQKTKYQTKLSWLREVIDWQQEITKTEKNPINLQQIFNEYVYIFTPQGDILELPKGATPIDFAYHIHSELGHHCTGAKINDKLVPLTSALKTGDRIEILTTKNSKPSRDWLVSSLGFLKTLRARTKVFHWFKKESKKQNISQGQELLDKEVKKLHLNKLDLKKATNKLHYKTNNDLLAALGRGDLKFSTILRVLEIATEKSSIEKSSKIASSKATKELYTSDINIEGVDNLLIHIANCCQPIPGKKIIGYVTLGRGIAIHQTDCANVLHSLKLYPERFISASWHKDTKQRYPIDIFIEIYDHNNFLQDIKNLLAEEDIKIINIDKIVNRKSATTKIKITIEISDTKLLDLILNKINKLPNIIGVHRNN